MRDASYVLGGWLLVLGVLAVYAAVLVVRGRRLARRLPPEELPWR
jgi:hypothetical protein